MTVNLIKDVDAVQTGACLAGRSGLWVCALALGMAASPVHAGIGLSGGGGGGIGVDVDIDLGGIDIDADVDLDGDGIDADVDVDLGGDGSGGGTDGGSGGGTDGGSGGGTGGGAGGGAGAGGKPGTEVSVSAANAGSFVCAKDGNDTSYNGYLVRDRAGNVVGWVHEATVSPAGKIVSVRMQSAGSSCYKVSGKGMTVGNGEVWANVDAASFR